MDDLDRRIDKAFTMVAFAANRHLVDHMRRKLEKLRQRGKVRRTEDGLWDALREGIDERTHAFTRESVKRLLSTARIIEGILQNSRPD